MTLNPNPKRPTKSDCDLSTPELRDEAIRRLKDAGFENARAGTGSKKLLFDADSDQVADACGIVMAVDSRARMRHDPA